MALIPAHCRSCGAIFPSKMISIEGNVKGLSLSNNSEPCPYCKGRAYLAEGVFDVAEDVISIINAPAFTREILSKFNRAVIDAYRDPSKKDDLIKVAESIDPSVADAVKRIASNNKLYMVGLFLLAMAIKSCNVDVSLDVNKLIDQLKDEPPQNNSIELYEV